uniref:Uncharacterized protein n=1 Tax=Arundo donax TaxID=35708 RepID=A0A0A8YQN0_ARUDO
MSPAFSSSRM